MSEQYSIYSKFDIAKHKETYINYLEVVQFQNDDIKSYVSSLPGLEGRTCYHIICPCCHNSTSVSAPIDETY